MPLTPFHWSIVILGLLLINSFYIPALLISSVIMDIEPFYYLFISPSHNGTIHGFFHTYAGATILGLAVAFILIKIRKILDASMNSLSLAQYNVSDSMVCISSLIAAYSHIFLDSFMHADMKPLIPITNSNPFLGIIPDQIVYITTGFSLFLSLFIYCYKFIRKK